MLKKTQIQRGKESIQVDTICAMEFGSHLYGMATPDSDRDIKGIYMPTREQRESGNFPKTLLYTTGTDSSRNTNLDTDIEYYSLDYFLKLACDGETVAIDMLHCNDESLLTDSGIWREIVSNRGRFLSKDIGAYVGYCQKQAAKYGLKGGRLSTVQDVLFFMCYGCKPKQRLHEVWDCLPDLPHTSKTEDFYIVCGKKLQKTVTVIHAIGILDKFEEVYGERARLALENNSVDWKAMSHAVRAGLQVMDLLVHGQIAYPLHYAKFLLDIKTGMCDFTYTLDFLEDTILSIKDIMKRSGLPDRVDRMYWEGFLQQQILNQVLERND